VGGTSLTVPGINITSIVNPSIESVYFQVDVSATTGATVTWTTLPSGYSVTNIGTGVYRISNIQNAADWNVIKNAVIHAPTGYNVNFNYICYIGYESTRTVTWTTSVAITQRASLTSRFTEYANGGYLFGITGIATESSHFSLYCLAQPWTKAQANISSATAMNTLGGYLQQTSGSLFDTSTLTEVTNRIRPGVLNLQSTSSINTSGLKLKRTSASLTSTIIITITAGSSHVFNNFVNTYYAGNIITQILPTGAIVESPGTDTYTVTFTLTDAGNFGTSTSLVGNSITYTGTESGATAFIQSVYYYPVKNQTTSSINYTFSISKNGVAEVTNAQRTLTYAGYNSTVGTAYSITSTSATSWTPIDADLLYWSNLKVLLVGGGSAGEPASPGPSAGAPGAGGEVLTYSGIALTNNSYSLSVGRGGNWTDYGGGLNSTFMSYTARGGLSWDQVSNGRSGTSGNGYLGGLPGTNVDQYGHTGANAGGSAGAGGPGGDAGSATYTDGYYPAHGGTAGPGVSSNITGTSVTYGCGQPGGTAILNYSGPSYGQTYTQIYGTIYNTPGSGGLGGDGSTTLYARGQNGFNGIIIIQPY